MKAIITLNNIVGVYYTLPIFESNPTNHFGWVWIDGLSKKSNSSKKDEYRLILVPNGNGIQEQLRSYGSPNFTDRDIRLINESYFYMLDHPDIKECEINLI